MNSRAFLFVCGGLGLALTACPADDGAGESAGMETGPTSTEGSETQAPTTDASESETTDASESETSDGTETGTETETETETDGPTETESSGTGESEPEMPELSLSYAAVKQFEFSWAEAAGADDYQLFELLAPNADPVAVGELSAQTQRSLTMPLHRRLGASYFVRACNQVGCTDSEPVIVSGTLAEAVGYFKASNTGDNDEFGWSVALSGDGQTFAVGTYHEASDATGIDGDQLDNSELRAGAVYVFVRQGPTWVQQAYVKASNTDAGDYFGWSVALSDTGNTLAVGAPREASDATGIDGDQFDDSWENAGAVYVFERDGDSWAQEAYIKASNTNFDDQFGAGLSLSGDGNTLAVGATWESSAATGVNGDQSDNSASDAGAVYVFAREGGISWSQQAYIKASNSQSLDRLGRDVSLSGDGNTLVAGAWGEASASAGVDNDEADNSLNNAGAVYVFEREGDSWSQGAYVKSSNPDGGDLFGWSVAIADDGDTFAVGAYGEDSAATGVNGDETDDSAAGAGAAYVFVREGMSWTQQAYVKASNTQLDDRYGRCVALNGDGSVLAVSADLERSDASGIDGDEDSNGAEGSGAIYVYERDGASWSQGAYVKASNPETFDILGYAVDLSNDGDTLAAGAHREASQATGVDGDQDDNSLFLPGAAYLF